MIGILCLGAIADWYGRKISYQIFTLLSMLILIGVYFIDEPYLWLGMRFVCGCVFLSQSTAKNVWTTEITSGVWRSRTQHWGHEIPIQMGLIVLGGLVYLLPGNVVLQSTKRVCI